MMRHILVWIYIFAGFFGMFSNFLYWLMSKKSIFQGSKERSELRKFVFCTFLTGLVSFFTFYSQYIILLRPENTAIQVLDYLLWACFLFYWINYLDSMVGSSNLRLMKKIVKYGTLYYIGLCLLIAYGLRDLEFEIANIKFRSFFLLLDVLFCILALLAVCLYAIRANSEAKNKRSGAYICVISFALIFYASYEFLNYAQIFSSFPAYGAWELGPFNATAFFLLFSNLITLIYVYYNDFSTSFIISQHAEESVDQIQNSSELNDNATLGSDTQVAFEPTDSIADSAEQCEREHVSSLYNLTPREQEVMEFICKGYNNAEIADELFISQNTVKHHIYNLFKKLNVKNRIELICLLRE
ncbi:MAG: hypothetical protein K0Q48_567 [Bacillota bacterium]|jgi:DNA-binding CsgD family transcriptional regulator|nr:hypothetical protein [Bacillota bacterium]